LIREASSDGLISGKVIALFSPNTRGALYQSILDLGHFAL